jgi:hypothetical protein
MSRLPLLALFYLGGSVADAGPFGLEMGMTIQQIGGNPQQVAPGKYKTTVVPKPHSSFESYVLEVGPHSGLCWIKGIGKNVSTSQFGVELHGAFDELKGKLDQVYGTSKVADYLLPGSMWTEPQYWMMGLLKKDRSLVAFWNASSGAKLPEGLKVVALMTSPINTNTGFVSVEYAFTNEKACDAELSKADDSAL